jgi:EpsD family peptidyl-prolyl cis-trans isomerase
MIMFSHGRRHWAYRLLLLMMCIPSLAACGKKVPEGQVVAVVDGEEVTRRDLAAEPQDGTLADGDAGQSALGAVLNGVVDRKLAVAEARRLELDRTPQYVAQAKRLDEVMLSRTLFDHWAAQMPQPNQQALADYIARNPQRFDGRKLFLVDRIETALNKDQSAALTPLQTNNAIAAYLDSQSKVYRRNRVVMDSASLTPALYRQVAALAPGYPLVIQGNHSLVILAVIETRAAPLASADRAAEAVKALKQVAVQQKLADLRKSAVIAYQPGYRPDKPSADATNRSASPK